MIALTLFVSTFAAVFALGLQSQFVNNQHRALAFFTSFAIGSSQLVILKLAPNDTSAVEVAAFLLGGPFGILASMIVYPRIAAWSKRRAAWRNAMRRR